MGQRGAALALIHSGTVDVSNIWAKCTPFHQTQCITMSSATDLAPRWNGNRSTGHTLSCSRTIAWADVISGQRVHLKVPGPIWASLIEMFLTTFTAQVAHWIQAYTEGEANTSQTA